MSANLAPMPVVPLDAEPVKTSPVIPSSCLMIAEPPKLEAPKHQLMARTLAVAVTPEPEAAAMRALAVRPKRTQEPTEVLVVQLVPERVEPVARVVPLGPAVRAPIGSDRELQELAVP